MNTICPLHSEGAGIDLLLDYVAGNLDKAGTAWLEQHMEVCSECAVFLAAQTEVWKALDVWEPAPVSMDFNRRLWRKIDEAAAAPWYRRLADSLRTGAWKPVLPLTAAVFMVATAFMMDHRGPVAVQQNVAISDNVSVTEAEQVEKTLDDLQLLRQLDASSAGETNSSPM